MFAKKNGNRNSAAAAAAAAGSHAPPETHLWSVVGLYKLNVVIP
jgi:hypothetical protein